MLITTPVAEIVRIQHGDVTIELDVDDALTLFGRLSGILPAMAAPEIERHAEHGWACPHCHAEVTNSGSLIEYDSHQGASDVEIDGDDAHVSQVDTIRETMVFRCGHCRKVVDIPAEMDLTWG